MPFFRATLFIYSILTGQTLISGRNKGKKTVFSVFIKFLDFFGFYFFTIFAIDFSFFLVKSA